jgi:hypothetical protein
MKTRRRAWGAWRTPGALWAASGDRRGTETAPPGDNIRSMLKLQRITLPLCAALAGAWLAGGAIPNAQDFDVQPEPLIISSIPVDAIAQSYDAPLAGASSPRNANYQIEATLDHAARGITGRETIRWRNISSRPTSELQFHLYWNAWRNADSSWMRERRLAGGGTGIEDDEWSRSDVSSIRVRRVPTTETVPGAPATDATETGAWIDLTDQMQFLAMDDGNTADRTVMTVPLTDPVLPNETVEIDIAWTARVPRDFARTGYQADYYFIAHWFPKIAVLENAGWNAHQFHSATEFYSDFGVYDIRITLPNYFVLGASGERVELDDLGNGTTTHHYRGEDIHDFAWTASPHFLDVEQTFEHPTLPNVQMRLLLQPEHADQEARHFDATAAALRYYGEWFGAYPYGSLTIVDPAWQHSSGGMEYPTLFTAGTRWLNPSRSVDPESVTVHEAGHQFFYGLVATNEFEDAWMDEGFNQYAQSRVQAVVYPDRVWTGRYFGRVVPYAFDDAPLSRQFENGMAGYRVNGETDVPATSTFRYWPGNSHFAISYGKTALTFHTLEQYLGWDTMRTILATYFERWRFRHPTPDDFFTIANEVSGQDLGWFFDQTYRSSNIFDYALRSLTSGADTSNGFFDTEKGLVVGARDARGQFRTVVVAERHGEATFPVEVRTTFADGETVTERWNGLGRRAIYTYVRDTRAVSAEVDPDFILRLDVQRTNNSLTTEPLGEAVSIKWALKWFVWLQDLLLTYGFFA